MTRLLGAIVAGGRSRRFGSDKALAEYDGRRLIDHVAMRMRPQVDALIVCGRELPEWTCLADRPAPDLGPLGGINAAVRHARLNGFDAVVTVPCDAPRLPADLVATLRAAGPCSYVAGLPVIALWPAALADALDDCVRSSDRSMRNAVATLGACPVSIPIANVNTRADLERLTAG